MGGMYVIYIYTHAIYIKPGTITYTCFYINRNNSYI